MTKPSLTTLKNTATVDEVVAVIRRDGGVIINGFLTPDVLAALQKDSDRLLNETAYGVDDFAGKKTRRVAALFAHTPYVNDVALHPLYIGAARELLQGSVNYFLGEEEVVTKPDIRIGVSSLVQLAPGESAQALHRDDMAFLWRHPTYGREARVQIMVAVSEFTQENGGTLVIPGSHLWDDHRAPKANEAVNTVMSAGSALIWIGSLYHGGGNNRSDTFRTGLSIAFDLACLRQEENMYLSLPIDKVKAQPEEIQKLLGWSSGENYMGWVMIDGRMSDPLQLLKDKPTTV